MSAFMHETVHIDALIHAGLVHARDGFGWAIPGTDPARFGSLTTATATEAGRVLLRENVESMAHLYDMKDMDNPADGGTRSIEYLGYLAQADEYEYRSNAARKEYTPVELLQALAGYEDQAFERPEWGQSEAKALCAALRLVLIRALPGYEAADTWAISG